MNPTKNNKKRAKSQPDDEPSKDEQNIEQMKEELDLMREEQHRQNELIDEQNMLLKELLTIKKQNSNPKKQENELPDGAVFLTQGSIDLANPYNPEEEFNIQVPRDDIVNTVNKFLKDKNPEIKKQIKEIQMKANSMKIDMNMLEAKIEEYLDCFFLIGFDINGDKVTISHADNSKDNDSLVEHLRSTFFKIINTNF